MPAVGPEKALQLLARHNGHAGYEVTALEQLTDATQDQFHPTSGSLGVRMWNDGDARLDVCGKRVGTPQCDVAMRSPVPLLR